MKKTRITRSTRIDLGLPINDKQPEKASSPTTQKDVKEPTKSPLKGKI